MRTRCSSISPKRALGGHALGIGGELAHRLDVSREPGKAMRGALLAIEHPADRRGLRPPPFRAPCAPRRRATRRVRVVAARARSTSSCSATEREAAIGIGTLGDGESSGAARHDFTCAVHKSKAPEYRAFLADEPVSRGDFSEIPTILTISRFPDGDAPTPPSHRRDRPVSCSSPIFFAAIQLADPTVGSLSVRTRIIVLALIPVVGFLANGLTYVSGESDVGTAFQTVKESVELADASRDFKSALAHMRLVVKDFTAAPAPSWCRVHSLAHALRAAKPRSPSNCRPDATPRTSRGCAKRCST